MRLSLVLVPQWEETLSTQFFRGKPGPKFYGFVLQFDIKASQAPNFIVFLAEKV